MVFNQEKRLVKKVKLKESVENLGSDLAQKLFPFSESDISDVIEKLVIMEAYKHNLLPEAEKKMVAGILNHEIKESPNMKQVQDPRASEFIDSNNNFLPLGHPIPIN